MIRQEPAVTLAFNNIAEMSPERVQELATWLRGMATLVEGRDISSWLPKAEAYFFNLEHPTCP